MKLAVDFVPESQRSPKRVGRPEWPLAMEVKLVEEWDAFAAVTAGKKTPAGKAMFQMMGVFAEFERTMIVERVNAGLARARAQGKRGRPLLAADKERAVRRLLSQGTGIVKTARTAGVGVSAVQRIKAAFGSA